MSPVDLAFAELVARYGPPTGGTNDIARWYARHTAEMHQIVARIRGGEAATGTPDLWSAA